MKKIMLSLAMLSLALGTVMGFAPQDRDQVTKVFPAKSKVVFDGTSGDCIIKKGPAGEIRVEILLKVTPSDAFQPEFEEFSDRLEISEDWRGNSRGSVVWTLTVPPETEFDGNTASGDFTVSGLVKEVEINTASGDVDIEDCSGEFDVSTASGEVEVDQFDGDLEISVASGDVRGKQISGRIEIETASGKVKLSDSRGRFEVECASGDIDVRQATIESSSEFSAASGDVEIVLAKTPESNVILSTASGDVLLDYNGNDFKGTFEFTARKRNGTISAPVKFDQEKTIDKWGEDYMFKSFSRSGNKPLIKLETASGDATLR